MDITSFMTWFVSQVVRMFTFTFDTLNNITFGGTSLLKVIIFINIIVPFLYIIITIPAGAGTIGADKVEKARKRIKDYNNKTYLMNWNEKEYLETGDSYHLNEWGNYRRRKL